MMACTLFLRADLSIIAPSTLILDDLRQIVTDEFINDPKYNKYYKDVADIITNDSSLPNELSLVEALFSEREIFRNAKLASARITNENNFEAIVDYGNMDGEHLLKIMDRVSLSSNEYKWLDQLKDFQEPFYQIDRNPNSNKILRLLYENAIWNA